MTLIEKAKKIATEAHAGQVRTMFSRIAKINGAQKWLMSAGRKCFVLCTN